MPIVIVEIRNELSVLYGFSVSTLLRVWRI